MLSPRIHLRDATRALHDRAEAAVDLPSRVGSREAYADLLAAMRALVEPVEAGLAGLDWAAAGLDLAPYRRAGLLRDDLRALGRDPGPAPPPAAAPPTLAEGLGVLYVLVGSALGGQIIARQARAALALGDDETRFFRSDGRDVGALWRAFGRALDAHAATPEALEAAVRGAERTFAAFEHALAPAPAPSA